MISHGIEISIAGGGAEEKDKGNRGLFSFLLFSCVFYHMIRYLWYKKLCEVLDMV